MNANSLYQPINEPIEIPIEASIKAPIEAPIDTIRPTVDEPPSQVDTDVPTIVNNDTYWLEDDRGNERTLNNRYCSTKEFQIKESIGNSHGPGSDRGRRHSRLDYLTMMFSPTQLQNMVRLTSIALLQANLNVTTKGGILNFLGS